MDILQKSKIEVIFFVIGTKGDVYPMVALARDLHQKGFEVTFLSNDYFKSDIENNGLTYYSVGTLQQYYKGNSADMWQPSSNGINILHDYHIPTFVPAFEYVRERYANNKNIVVVSMDPICGARAAANILDIPSVQITLSPNMIPSFISPPAPECWRYPKWVPSFIKRILLQFKEWQLYRSSYDRHVDDQVNYARKQLGKKTFGRKSKKTEVLHIGFFPEWFGMRPSDWPSELKLVGFPLCHSVNNQATAVIADFIQKHGSPLVFTTGTGISNAQTLMDECKVICSKLNVPGIFVGKNVESGNITGGFLCIDYVDFSYLLPKCKAIVHHGGVGTIAQAIMAGIPQLIRPLKFDQPDNAFRIHKLGLGEFVYPKNFNPDNVAPILKHLMECAESNSYLSIFSADIKRNNAIERASLLIEKKIKELSF